MTSIPDVEQLFDESEPGDWKHFESEFGLVDDGEGITPMWVYEHDVSLRIEQGRVAVDEFSEPWSDRFADSENNRSYTYWLVYGNSPIEQHVVVSVDGGRADIPVPSMPDGENDSWTISEKERKLGAIISRNYQEFQRRLDIAEIEVV